MKIYIFLSFEFYSCIYINRFLGFVFVGIFFLVCFFIFIFKAEQSLKQKC